MMDSKMVILMSEERFTIDWDLEELDDENVKLRAKILEQQVIITELNKQIEQLNLAIDDLLTHTSCEEAKKENSDLRQNIKIIKDLLSECDLFSDKATEHDIIAYRELHKFDNKDAYSIACAIAKIKKVIDDE